MEYKDLLAFINKKREFFRSFKGDCAKCLITGDACGVTELSEEDFNLILNWKPPVDWSKVAVDTPIWVWHEGMVTKCNRHFAKFEDGRVFAFDDGRTSWTTEDIVSWEHAELAEVDGKVTRMFGEKVSCWEEGVGNRHEN